MIGNEYLYECYCTHDVPSEPAKWITDYHHLVPKSSSQIYKYISHRSKHALNSSTLTVGEAYREAWKGTEST